MAESILTKDIINKLESCMESGYLDELLHQLEQYLEEGIGEGHFSLADAEGDLEVQLWRSYVYNNYDLYESYIDSEQCLRQVEDKASGCGTWYYRYGCALLYLGRLEEAWNYAEKGVKEEPGYPWGWLLLSSLRCHFGDREGALEAVEAGLKLEPNNYEFLQRRQEILDGKSIVDMECHYIEEEVDQRLTQASEEEEEFRDKRMALKGILCNEDNLKQVFAVLEEARLQNWKADHPYCTFEISYKDRPLLGCFRMNQNTASKTDAAWLGLLMESLESMDRHGREWISEMIYPQLKNWELSLQSLIFERDGSVTLGFRIIGAKEEQDESIEVYFSHDLTVNRETQDNYNPEVYTQQELNLVEEHIGKYFGAYANVFHEIISPDIHVDICVIEPTPERNYYTLVTMGAGAHLMNVPEDVDQALWGRQELFLCLPPDWNIPGSSEDDYWPIRCLKKLARMPGERNTWLCILHTVAYGEKMADSSPFTGVILLGPQDTPVESAYCPLPDGTGVNFYQVFPLHPGELQYKMENGGEGLLATMAEVPHVIDISRPDVHAGYEPVLPGWGSENGCIATNRILREGRPIGYLYREEPMEEFPDSGWRFAAGDETEEYMEDPNNSGIYDIRSVCEFDPDVMPLLAAPCGTAYYRDENGVFQKESYRRSSKLN